MSYPCPECGAEMTRVECWECGGEGVSGHDCGEDTCCCMDPDDNMTCELCNGKGGWPDCPTHGTDGACGTDGGNNE